MRELGGVFGNRSGRGCVRRVRRLRLREGVHQRVRTGDLGLVRARACWAQCCGLALPSRRRREVIGAVPSLGGARDRTSTKRHEEDIDETNSDQLQSCDRRRRRSMRSSFAACSLSSARVGPDNVRWTALVLEDGVTFMHTVEVEARRENPIPTLTSFKRYNEAVLERCEEQARRQPGTRESGLTEAQASQPEHTVTAALSGEPDAEKSSNPHCCHSTGSSAAHTSGPRNASTRDPARQPSRS